MKLSATLAPEGYAKIRINGEPTGYSLRPNKNGDKVLRYLGKVIATEHNMNGIRKRITEHDKSR